MISRPNYLNYYLIFAVMLLVNLILRYPSDGIRGGGSDSWDYFTQANQIIGEGKISWIYNVLSIYGFYPPYQEMGTALIFASFSSVSGLAVHNSIFVVSLFLGIFSFLIANIFFRHLFSSDFIALLIALFVSCSNDISSSTSWIIHARYTLTIFSFFILFLMVKSYSTRINFNFLLLLIISLLVFGTLHRSSIWLLFLTILYFSINFFSHRIKKYNVLPFSYKFYLINFYFGIIFLTLFISISGNLSSKFNFFLNWLINLSINHGIPCILIIFAVPFFYRQRLTSFKLTMMLIYILIFLRIDQLIFYNSFDFVYFSYIGFGLTFVLDYFRNNPFSNIVIFLISIIFVITPTFVQVHSVPKAEGYDTISDFSAAFFLRDLSYDSPHLFVYGQNTTNEKIDALTGVKRYDSNLIKHMSETQYEFQFADLVERKEGMVATYGIDRKSTDSEFMKYQIDTPLTENYIQSRNYTYIISNEALVKVDSEYEKYFIFVISAESERYSIYLDENIRIHNI